MASSTCADPGAIRASDRLGAKALGACQPFGHHVHGKDARRAKERSALQRHDPHGAEAHDDDGRAWLNGGAQRPEVTGGKDVGEEHRLFAGDAIGDGQGEEIGEGDRHRLGLAAGKVGHRPKCGGHAGEADVGLAGQARAADAAPDHAGDEHAVARLEGAYMGTSLGHRADGLVPEADAVAGRGVVVQVQIRSADGRALDGDDDTLGPRQHRIGNILDRDVARPG